ncbi:trypsin alpha-3-like [Teleopsis dalmanni]|uniref:trypsin alpha-3-like n=1 Tax=Teleopsis dalmanni TaxID=139649 RepID=UPI0018CE530E|nr:trypsin alpha-3-like [Teleopsis dalmanni]
MLKMLTSKFSILIVLNILILTLSQITHDIDDVNKIVGGQVTDITRAPYMVNLRLDGKFACGGSLISPTCVLTAGHCAYKVERSKMLIQAGVTNLTETGVIAKVRRALVPDAYRDVNGAQHYDVAILVLNKTIEDRRIETIPISYSSLSTGTKINIFGWGKTKESSKVPSVQLKRASIEVISKASCKRALSDYFVSKTTFCATLPGRDTCQGDSGGPTVYQGRQYGIVSWGRGCARVAYPGVYTSLKEVRPWLEKTINQYC